MAPGEPRSQSALPVDDGDRLKVGSCRGGGGGHVGSTLNALYQLGLPDSANKYMGTPSYSGISANTFW